MNELYFFPPRLCWFVRTEARCRRSEFYGLQLGAAVATDLVRKAVNRCSRRFHPTLPVGEEETAPFMEAASWLRSSSLPVFTLRLLLSCCWAFWSRFFSLSFAIIYLFTFIGFAAACGNIRGDLLNVMVAGVYDSSFATKQQFLAVLTWIVEIY